MTEHTTGAALAPPTVDRARLRRLRVEAGLTATMLAIRSGCAQSTIAGIESGRRQPSPPLLIRIAAALGVTPAALLLPEAASAHR